MNKRRQTRSPRLLYLALAAVVLGPTAPPLPAQGTGKRVIELPGTETLAIGTSPSKATTAKVGQDLLALYAEYQAHLKDTSGQRAAAPAFKSSNAIAPVAADPSSSMPRHPATPRPLPPICARSAPRTSRRSDAWYRAAWPSSRSRRSRISPPCSSPAPPMRPRPGRGNESGGPRDARGHPWSPGRCSAWRASIRRAIHNLKCLSRHSAMK